MKKIYVGGVEVPVKATGFTTVLFKRFTGNDLMSVLSDKTRVGEKINDVLALFYCMNIQSKDLSIGQMLNEVENITGYYEFLNKFESTDLYGPDVMAAVINTWISSSEQSSTAKNA